MDPEFRVAFRPGCAKGAIYVSRAEPGAISAMPESVENRQVVLAARLVTDDVEQVRLERLPALTGQLTEPVAQFLGNVTNLKGNHACNNTCKRGAWCRPRSRSGRRQSAWPAADRVEESFGLAEKICPARPGSIQVPTSIVAHEAWAWEQRPNGQEIQDVGCMLGGG